MRQYLQLRKASELQAGCFCWCGKVMEDRNWSLLGVELYENDGALVMRMCDCGCMDGYTRNLICCGHIYTSEHKNLFPIKMGRRNGVIG